MKLHESLVEIDGRVYFDHRCEYCYSDPKIWTLQLRGAGVQKKTIKRIVMQIHDVTEAKIDYWISRFQRFYEFREIGATRKRNEIYCKHNIKHFGEIGEYKFGDDFSNDNKPLINKRENKNKGIFTKDECLLLKDIKNGVDFKTKFRG